MKNTFSKSLLCGILASTFLLANCQKAPSGRGVKSAVGDPGTPTDTTAGKVTPADDVNLAMAKCTPEFNLLYISFHDYYLATNEMASNKDGVDRKEELLKRRQEINGRASKTLAEMAKLKPDATMDKDEKIISKQTTATKVDGCYNDEKKPTTIKHINNLLDRAEKNIANTTGQETARSTAARGRIEKNEIDKLLNLSFKVSKELNELLADEPSKTNKHFADGKVVDKASFEDNKNNKEISVCYVSVAARKLEDDKLVLKSAPPGSEVVTKGNKKIFSMNFVNGVKATEGEDMYQITCFIPEKLSVAEGLVKAMGFSLTRIKENQTPTPAKENMAPEVTAEGADKAQEDRLRDEKVKPAKAATDQVTDDNTKTPAVTAPSLTTKTGSKADAAASAKALADSLKEIERRSVPVNPAAVQVKEKPAPVAEKSVINEQQEKEMQAKASHLESERLTNAAAIEQQK